MRNWSNEHVDLTSEERIVELDSECEIISIKESKEKLKEETIGHEKIDERNERKESVPSKEKNEQQRTKSNIDLIKVEAKNIDKPYIIK